MNGAHSLWGGVDIPGALPWCLSTMTGRGPSWREVFGAITEICVQEARTHYF